VTMDDDLATTANFDAMSVFTGGAEKGAIEVVLKELAPELDEYCMGKRPDEPTDQWFLGDVQRFLKDLQSAKVSFSASFSESAGAQMSRAFMVKHQVTLR